MKVVLRTQWNNLAGPEMHRNRRIRKSFDACNNTGSRSRLTTRVGFQTGFDTMLNKTGYSHTGGAP